MATIEAVDYTSADASERFVASLRSTGFGVLKNHPIPEKAVTTFTSNGMLFSQATTNKTIFSRRKPMTGSSRGKKLKQRKATRSGTSRSIFIFIPGANAPQNSNQISTPTTNKPLSSLQLCSLGSNNIRRRKLRPNSANPCPT